MRDLIIAGTGVHSAEMAEIVERINRVEPAWNLLGYLSPDGSRIGEVRNGYPVLGPPEAVEDYPDTVLVPDNEWPRSPGLPLDRLVSLVDPSAYVSRTASIGRGCVFYPSVFVGLNARIGDRVFVLSGSVINHDDILEDGVVVASGVTLAGSVHVESGCYLGQSCSVRQETRIGRGSLIGMGSVVLSDVPPGSVVVGNPGRLMTR